VTTAADGYFDESGNWIPGSFADQLDLPGPQETDPAAAAAAQAALTGTKKQSAQTLAQINAGKAKVKTLEAQLKGKSLTPAAKKRITAQLSAAKTQVSARTAARHNLLGTQAQQQNKVYEVSGQYEKLLAGDQRDAYAALRSLFDQYGLGSLAGKIYEFAKNGYGADVISLMLQDTKEYKERFAGNDARVKAGMGVLTPAEYLATEQAYRQILSSAGLPKGFYDNPADFQNWISGDVSPTEVKSRVDLAVQNSMQANPAAKAALEQLYGIDESHVMAYYLDEKKALPLLTKQSQAAAFGAEALKRGLSLNLTNLEDFVTAGLSLNQVSSGFQQVAEALPNIQAIAARWGETFGQSELEQDLVGGVETGGLGTTRRKRLASQERGLFGGYGGSTPAGLSAGFQAT